MANFFYELLLPVSLAGCLASLVGLCLTPALKKLRWKQQRGVQIAGVVSCFGGAKKQTKTRLQAVFQPNQTKRSTAVLVALLVAVALTATACTASALSDSSSVLEPTTSINGENEEGLLPDGQPDSEPNSEPTSEPLPKSQPGDSASSADNAAEPATSSQLVDATAQPEPFADAQTQVLQSFVWPVPNYSYVSRDMDEAHKGADLVATRGDAVVAMTAGRVTEAQWHYSYGNYVVIDHGNEVSTLYAHLDTMTVETGQTVEQSQQIGTVGQTGATTGVACHVEVIIAGQRKNLKDFFPEK